MQALPLLSSITGLASQAVAFTYNSVRAIRDPTDGAAVSAVGELSSLEALENTKRVMLSDRTGRTILRYQPHVTDETLHYATSLPEGTFGQRYAAYMNHNGFTPSGRTPVKHIADPTLAYVMTRYRQCHDFLHTCTGAGRTVEEELALKLLEFYHTGLPLGVLAVAGGSPHLTSAQRDRMKVYRRWAKENKPCYVHGERQIPMYLNVPWEDLLGKPYEEVVAYAGLTPLPEYMSRLEGTRKG